MKGWDIALVEDKETGELEAHTANCPYVRALAEAGEPVATLLGCERLPDNLPHRECLSALARTIQP